MRRNVSRKPHFSCNPWPSLLSKLHRDFSSFAGAAAAGSASVNDICRLLSDYRQAHDDLESALTASVSASIISTDLIEQVLKRSKGLGASAHRFFLWASKSAPDDFHHSDSTYSILVDVLGRARLFPFVWDLFYQLRDGGGGGVRPELFWLLFRSYCRAKLPEDAIRAFGRMADFVGSRPGPDDFHQLLLNLCSNRLVGEATDVFSKWEPATVRSYCVLMKGWVDSGRPEEAVKLFDEMRNRKFDVDVIAYNTYIGALCKSGDFGRAHKVFREMKTNGRILPDASSYGALLRAYCAAGDVGSADSIVHQMRRQNLVPNLFTHNCLLRLLCRHKKLDEAYGILDEMVQNGLKPDTWSYNAILAVHCELREVTRALRLTKRMEKEGYFPDVHTYNMLLKTLVEVGRYDRVEEVWDGMRGRGRGRGFYPSSSTYAVMIHGLSKKKGKIGEACKYLQMMVEEGIPPYLHTCEMMRDCLLRLNLSDDLHAVRSKMRRSSSLSIQALPRHGGQSRQSPEPQQKSSRRRTQATKKGREEEEDDDHAI